VADVRWVLFAVVPSLCECSVRGGFLSLGESVSVRVPGLWLSALCATAFLPGRCCGACLFPLSQRKVLWRGDGMDTLSLCLQIFCKAMKNLFTRQSFVQIIRLRAAILCKMAMISRRIDAFGGKKTRKGDRRCIGRTCVFPRRSRGRRGEDCAKSRRGLCGNKGRVGRKRRTLGAKPRGGRRGVCGGVAAQEKRPPPVGC